MAPVRPQIFQQLDQTFNKYRILPSIVNLFLILYIPIGVILFIIRVCMLLQALVILSIIPKGFLQSILLRVLFGVMGLVVTLNDSKRRSTSARMLVSNRISHLDHITLHLVMECTTTSLVGREPLLYYFFYHHHFNTDNLKEIEESLKQLPEFDDNVSIPDSAAIPYIAQPESLPSNGQSLLKFSVWPFTVENIVQPISLSWWRPFDIPYTTLNSSDWSDLFWVMFLPVTIVTVKILPTIVADDNKSTEEFSKKTREKMASLMGVVNLKATPADIKMWKEEYNKVLPLRKRAAGPTGPLISESEFSGIETTPPEPEVERMVYQVVGVLPHVPVQVVRQDLMKTRNVDVTVTNILEGKIKFDTPPPPQSPPPHPPNKPKTKEKFSLEDGHRTYQERKKSLLENAKRNYAAKYGLS